MSKSALAEAPGRSTASGETKPGRSRATAGTARDHADALGAAHRKWSGGTILLWYPVKDAREITRFIKQLAAMHLTKSLQIQLSRTVTADTRLRGTGLIVVNAPWTLQTEAQILLPALAGAFWPGASNEIRIAALSS